MYYFYDQQDNKVMMIWWWHVWKKQRYTECYDFIFSNHGDTSHQCTSTGTAFKWPLSGLRRCTRSFFHSDHSPNHSAKWPLIWRDREQESWFLKWQMIINSTLESGGAADPSHHEWFLKPGLLWTAGPQGGVLGCGVGGRMGSWCLVGTRFQFGKMGCSGNHIPSSHTEDGWWWFYCNVSTVNITFLNTHTWLKW